jgi:DnaD/phage-associated family protein
VSKKQRRRRRNKRRSQQQTAPATPAALIKRGDFEGAAAQLKAQVEKKPTDGLRRKLTYCYVQLAKYQEAIATLYSLEDRVAHDLGLIGWCFIQLEDWEQAVEKLDEALGVEEFTEGYYWLAVARAEGRKQYYELEEEEGASIRELLRTATKMPRCRLDAFLWLEELHRRGAKEAEKRAEILKEAVESHAESVEARSRLADLLIFRLDDPEQALITVSPLLEEDQPTDIALGYAFYASKKMGNVEKAFEYLEKIEPDPERPEVGLVLMKGDTLVALGHMSEALSHYDEAVEVGDLEQRILGLFGKARVAIRSGDAQRAVHDARQAADLWFEALIDDESFSLGNPYVLLGDEPFDYKDSLVSVEEVSRKLLDENYQGELDDELTGRLIYLRYKYEEHAGHADEDKLESLLVRAHEVLEHPLVSRDLSFYYLEPGKISKGVRHHLNYALWKHSTYDSSTPFPSYLAELDFLNWEDKPIVGANDRASVHQAALSHLETSGEEAVRAVMVPFYESFWRRLLFEGEMFEEVLELTGALSKSVPGKALLLFDHAYALNEINRTAEAEAAYRRLLAQHPDHASGLHNLSIIVEGRGRFEEALELSDRAAKFAPQDSLIINRANRLNNRAAQRRENMKRQEMLLRSSGLARAQLEELNEFYWYTDLSTSELKTHFGLSKAVHHFISPLSTDEKCPNCGAFLAYRSRSARDRDESECQECEHKGRSIYACRCEYCSALKAREERRRKEEMRQRAMEDFEAHKERVSEPGYVHWAVSKLSRRQRLFLKAFIEVVDENDHPTWDEICDRAGVVSHQTYLNKLVQLGLLLKDPDNKVSTNPVVDLELLPLEDNVRKVSNSLRFEVFQRDEHTCQYCGRKAPEVELQVDHLIPVARGGTDHFENLITSCRECNSGKSAKLIKHFTKGYTKEEWRERIRQKRAQILKERRSQIENVIQFWAECRNTKSVSQYDTEAIYSFIEKYEPEWIKAAIRIAAQKQPSNYRKYVAGILRNWAKVGPPEYVADPAGAYDRALEDKKASQKQIGYVAALLDKLGLSLEESYHKTDFDELTMLDARNLIEALTERGK